MRNQEFTTHFLAVSLLTGVLAPFAAQAGDPPTTSQIIDSLTPGSGPLLTRGIRLGGQQPAEAKPAAAASVAAPAKQAEASLTVSFRTGSAILSPGAARVLDHLGEALTSPKLADYKFRVEGHTDTVGSPDANKTLSEQRAAAVLDYLATKFNVDRARLTPVGMGQDGLLVETGPGVPDERNRRVVVVNLGR